MYFATMQVYKGGEANTNCKLDINQSVPENILSHPEVKRKQCGGDRYYANIRA
jgi:hypothetical protein